MTTTDETTQTTDRTEPTVRTPVDVLRESGYATIGATDVAVSYLRRLGARAGDVRGEVPNLRQLRPANLTSSLRSLGADVEHRFELLAGRGRDVVGTLQHSRPARMASARARVARSQVRATGATVRRAGEAGEQVVEEATETVGTPKGVEYESLTIGELRELARERRIAGRSDMNKAELIAALRSV
jgi:hypothetical protein